MWGWLYGSDGMDTSWYNLITLITQIDLLPYVGGIYGGMYWGLSLYIDYWFGESGVVCHL